jgi:hypothetical protein
VAVVAGPLPDVLHALAVVGRGGGRGPARGAAATGPGPGAGGGPAGTAGSPDVRREGVAQVARVLLADVDLVVGAVEAEDDRLRALHLVVVQVAHEHDLDLLRHWRDSPVEKPCESAGVRAAR